MATAQARLPMAGYAKLGIAIEDAFGEPGCFMAAYDANRAMSSSILAESDLVVAAIVKFMSGRANWRGTATDLARLPEPLIVPPKRHEPTPLAGRLRRLAPVLRPNGIEIAFERQGKGRDRLITISR